MKQKRNLLAMTVILGLSLQVQAQQTTPNSGVELFKQGNAQMRHGGCEDAKKAINFYNKAMKVDRNLRIECSKNIEKCKKIIGKGCDARLELTEKKVEIPYQGGDQFIGVISSSKWNYEGKKEKWMNIEKDDKGNVIVSCPNQNNSTRERTTTLKFISGSFLKELEVVQAARPQYIEVDVQSLNFPPSGATETVKVESNVNWSIENVADWCKVEKSDSTIQIIVSPNERTLERDNSIVLKMPNDEKVIVKIHQIAGRERLSLSQNDISLPSEGGKHFMRVYTDADNWFIGDFPNWLNVEKVGNDSICIEADKYATYSYEELARSGSVQIKTDRQTVGVMVRQSPKYVIEDWWNRKTIPGRNISLGVSASYYMPFVSTTAGGDYVGSVVDYSLGNSQENASYKSAVGYSFGLFADMRLYKNIYLMAGMNFTQIKYKNTFGLNTIRKVPSNTYQYLMGEVQNSYTEEYSHTMLEVPILASYRFPINDVSHVQLNLGPVFNFGMTAKMDLTGNTNTEKMHLYNRGTDTQVGPSDIPHHTSTQAEFDLYKSCVAWTEAYTTGNTGTISDHVFFSDSPMHRFNWGVRAGAAYEIAGISFGIYYTMMLSNMANDGYWENKRWTVLNESNQVMPGYKHRIHTLELKLAYTMRYLGMKKKKN
ncbi:MAG: outer membrane beta-barrel protein [Prevotella sp.]|nr:outer membrane beta-barrel protein [Prevotella sp.]